MLLITVQSKKVQHVLAACGESERNDRPTQFPFVCDGGNLNTYHVILVMHISTVQSALELADQKGCISIAIEIERLNKDKINQVIQSISDATLLNLKVVTLYGNRSNITNARKILRSRST